MNFLCSTYGSSGDVFPMLGLAIAIKEHGHDVVFATNEHYGPLTQRCGIPFKALGTEAEFQACIQSPDLWTPRRAFQHIFAFIKSSAKEQYELYCEHATKKEAVGITNCFGLGALNAREKTGLPVLTLHCQPAVIWSKIEPPLMPGMFGPKWLRNILFGVGVRWMINPAVEPFLNPWRQELGLPPVRDITTWWHSPDGVIAMFPEWFCPPQKDWPLRTMQTDFPMWNAPIGDALPSDVENFLIHGKPPIVFTPGSANIHGKKFFATAVDACQRIGERAILLTEFPEQLPPKLPSDVAHFSYVPLDMLLPRCAAFVHHGGIGSTSQAMAAGIPQLIMPLAHDQFDNAERLIRLQLGDRLVPARFTGPRVASMLKKLLKDPNVQRSCATITGRMSSHHNGLAKSVSAIEQWYTSLH